MGFIKKAVAAVTNAALNQDVANAASQAVNVATSSGHGTSAAGAVAAGAVVAREVYLNATSGTPDVDHAEFTEPKPPRSAYRRWQREDPPR